jgi:tetratricopeptide (TPR) repeat protein
MNDLEMLVYNYKTGLNFFYKKDYDNALNYFNKAVSFRFEYTPAILMKSLCFFKLGNLKQALEEATSAAIYEPECAHALLLKGYFDYKAGNLDLVTRTLKKCLKINKNNGLCNYILSEIYFKINKPNNGFKEIAKAYEKDQSDFIRYNYSKRLLTKDKKNALIVLEKLENYAPAQFLYAKNIIEYNPGKAEQIFISLIKNKKFREPSMYNLSRIYIKQRVFNKAAGLLSKLFLLNTHKFKYCYETAQTFYLSGYLEYANDFINYADKMCGLDKRDIEKEAKVLKLKIRILFKTKCERESILIPLKRLEYLSKSHDYSLFVEKSYIKLYKKFNNKSDYKTALHMRQQIGKTLTGTIYSEYSGKLRKWVLITVLFLVLIFILWEIIALFQ